VNNALVLAANLLALAGAYMLWDLSAWFRDRYSAGRFKTIVGALGAHFAIILIYCFITYQVLATAPYFLLPE
jgi:hypothetical protein